MTDFSTACLDTAPLDPFKRVRYATGLVLGVDEFLQEETYLLGKHRRHNRLLHGYGTVCGLAVTVNAGADPEVIVTAGIAIDPKGREIRVPRAQCARLNEWLTRSGAADQGVGSPPPALSVAVVLCYRECPTDRVPIPGGPCRTLEDSSAFSRTEDAFELSLRIDELPDQTEEDAIRAFGALLGTIDITDAAVSFMTLEDVEALVRTLLSHASPPIASPPTSPVASPSSPPETRAIRPEDATAFLRAAIRVWVTEVRPALSGAKRDCASGPAEGCVLLARLEFAVAEGSAGLQVQGDVAVDQDDRPVLLQTRVLQERWWWGDAGSAFAGQDVPRSAPRFFGFPPSSAPSRSEEATDVTRILATSWEHGGTAPLEFDLDGASTSGFVIAFGRGAIGDARVRVGDGGIDEASLEVLVERPDRGGLVSMTGIAPSSVVPVEPAVPGGPLTSVRRVPGPLAPAVAVVLESAVMRRLRTGQPRARIRFNGDAVMDDRGQPIAARRGSSARAASPGGTFESWARLSTR